MPHHIETFLSPVRDNLIAQSHEHELEAGVA